MFNSVKGEKKTIRHIRSMNCYEQHYALCVTPDQYFLKLTHNGCKPIINYKFSFVCDPSLTDKCNLWLVVSLKWLIQEQGFIAFRQIDDFFFCYILFWLTLGFEGTRFDTCSLPNYHDYNKIIIKSHKNL